MANLQFSSDLSVMANATDSIVQSDSNIANRIENAHKSLNQSFRLWQNVIDNAGDKLSTSEDSMYLLSLVTAIEGSHAKVLDDIQVVTDLNTDYNTVEYVKLQTQHQFLVGQLKEKAISFIEDSASVTSNVSLSDRAKFQEMKVRSQVKFDYSQRRAELEHAIQQLNIQETVATDKAVLEVMNVLDIEENRSSLPVSTMPTQIMFTSSYSDKAITCSTSHSSSITTSNYLPASHSTLSSCTTSHLLTVSRSLPIISRAPMPNCYPQSLPTTTTQTSVINSYDVHAIRNPVALCHSQTAAPISSVPIMSHSVAPSNHIQPAASNVFDSHNYYGSHSASQPPVMNGYVNQQPYHGTNQSYIVPPPPVQHYIPQPIYIPPSRRPLPEPKQFSGETQSDLLEYPSWRCSFETLILNSGISDAERIYYLGNYVKGKAYEAIAGYLSIGDSNSFDRALQVLDERYGNHFVISNSFRSKLNNWPKISNSDRIGLRSFSDFLNQCLLAKDRYNMTVLDDELENAKMLEKLPSWMISKWAKQVYKSRINHNVFPPFTQFVKFVERESDVFNDPILLSLHNYPHSRQKPHTTVYAHNTSVHDQRSCDYCKDSHFLDNCDQFLALSMSDRRKFTRDNRLCYGCLEHDHVKADCKSKLVCNKCKKYHPTSLHYDFNNNNNEQSTHSSKSDENQ